MTEIGTWYYIFNIVHIYKNISQFFHVLHSKPNYFETLELHVKNLIVIFLHYDCSRKFYFVLFLRSN